MSIYYSIGGPIMKSTGVVRKIDEMGRVVIPMEIRKTLDIKDGDSLEIFIDNDNIIFHKYQPSCTFCGSCDDIQFYLGKRICRACIERVKEQF